ncbi:hypothetical protein GCM10025871_09470 [Deinococcus metallilatus]|nr:hypothetical protein GCM10025871_09470 [Deinococcus metallilatus]
MKPCGMRALIVLTLALTVTACQQATTLPPASGEQTPAPGYGIGVTVAADSPLAVERVGEQIVISRAPGQTSVTFRFNFDSGISSSFTLSDTQPSLTFLPVVSTIEVRTPTGGWRAVAEIYSK